MRRFPAHGSVVCCIALLAASPAYARRAGAPPQRNGSINSAGANCSACHAGSTGFATGSVQILDAPSQYNFNRVYNLRVRVTDSVQAGAGFELSAESGTGAPIGTLQISDATNTQLTTGNSNYATHTSTGVTNAVANWAGMGNVAEYNVRWKGPATNLGTVTFYAAGNAINNSFTNSGDRVYLTNVAATPVACLPGDVNNDGRVDGADVQDFVRVWLDSNVASPVEFCASDMNSDGAVSGTDIDVFTDKLLNP